MNYVFSKVNHEDYKFSKLNIVSGQIGQAINGVVFKMLDTFYLDYYPYGDGTCLVIGPGNYEGTTIVVPEKSPEGDRVIAIDDNAFEEYKDKNILSKVVIANTVKTIGEKAFYGFGSLSQVEFKENSQLTTIKNYAFAGCNLQSFVLPKSVTKIGQYAFQNCSNLRTFTFENNTNIRIIERYAFSNCSNLAYTEVSGCKYLGSASSPYIYLAEGYTEDGIFIPNQGTKIIGTKAFYEDSELTQISASDSNLTYIGYGAFGSCPNLKHAYLSNTITSMDDAVFSHCYNLTNAVLSENLNKISKDTFIHCRSLSSVNFPQKITSIGPGAFFHCIKLTTIEIPPLVESIGKDAFSGRKVVSNETNENMIINTIYIKSRVLKSIDDQAFARCYANKEIYMHDIDNWCLIEFGSDATPNSYGTTTTKLYQYIETAGEYVKVDVIVTPQNMKKVSHSLFRGFDIERIMMHGSSEIEVIEGYAFHNCKRLTDVSMPPNLNRIDQYAFNATGITKLDFPASVSYIGGYCFRNTQLNRMNFYSSIGPQIEGSAFLSSIEGFIVTIPRSTTIRHFIDNSASSTIWENLHNAEKIWLRD